MLKQLTIFEKRANKINTNAQNSYYYVKIGFWILTTNFTKTALIIKKNPLDGSFTYFFSFLLIFSSSSSSESPANGLLLTKANVFLRPGPQ